MRTITLCLAISLFTCAALPPGVSAECPRDSVFACGWEFSTAPTLVKGGSCPLNVFSRAEYDLTSGTAISQITGALYSLWIAAETRTSDAFTLNGPGISPITFHARLVLSYSSWSRRGCGGQCPPGTAWMGARLRQGATVVGDSLKSVNDGSFSVVRTIEVPITRGPGESFSLAVSTYTRVLYLAYGLIEARLEFPDLPPGYTVVSCQGYQAMGEQPTPTARHSWGRLKAAYR